jgi:hypothetical protein
MCETLHLISIVLLIGAIGMMWVLHSVGKALNKQDERDKS